MGFFWHNVWFDWYDIFAMFYLAVVNLTLIDLPGLTKVAVGNYFSFFLCYACVSLNFRAISGLCVFLLQIKVYSFLFCDNVSLLQRDSPKILFKILKTWSARMLRRWTSLSVSPPPQKKKEKINHNKKWQPWVSSTSKWVRQEELYCLPKMTWLLVLS